MVKKAGYSSINQLSAIGLRNQRGAHEDSGSSGEQEVPDEQPEDPGHVAPDNLVGNLRQIRHNQSILKGK